MTKPAMPPSFLRIDAPTSDDVPADMERLASKIVIGGKVVKNRFGPVSASIGVPIGGPKCRVTLPITKEMVEKEAEGAWTYLTCTQTLEGRQLTVKRDDEGHAAAWVAVLRNSWSMRRDLSNTVSREERIAQLKAKINPVLQGLAATLPEYPGEYVSYRQRSHAFQAQLVLDAVGILLLAKKPGEDPTLEVPMSCPDHVLAALMAKWPKVEARYYVPAGRGRCFIERKKKEG